MLAGSPESQHRSWGAPDLSDRTHHGRGRYALLRPGRTRLDSSPHRQKSDDRSPLDFYNPVHYDEDHRNSGRGKRRHHRPFLQSIVPTRTSNATGWRARRPHRCRAVRPRIASLSAIAARAWRRLRSTLRSASAFCGRLALRDNEARALCLGSTTYIGAVFARPRWRRRCLRACRSRMPVPTHSFSVRVGDQGCGVGN